MKQKQCTWTSQKLFMMYMLEISLTSPLPSTIMGANLQILCTNQFTYFKNLCGRKDDKSSDECPRTIKLAIASPVAGPIKIPQHE